MLLVGAATFFFWLSLYLYVPILPLHAEALGASLTMVGAVVASYAIAQVLLRIPIGVGADILGRRKPFAIGALALTTAGALGLALAPDPWALFGARALTGVGAAGWVAISVLWASYYGPDRTTAAMARIMAVNTTAIVLATLSGGLIADAFGAESTFYGGAAAGLVGIAALLIAREPAPPRRAGYSVRTFARVARTPLLLTVGGIGILFQFVAFGGVFGFVPVYADRIGASDAEVGYVTTAMLATSVAGALGSAWLVARFGSRKTILIPSLVIALSMIAVPFIGSIAVLAASQAAGGLGRGILNTVLISLSLRDVGGSERATAMGVYQAVYAIGMLSGPVVTGVVADFSGLDNVFYLLAAVSVAGGLAGLMRVIPRD